METGRRRRRWDLPRGKVVVAIRSDFIFSYQNDDDDGETGKCNRLELRTTMIETRPFSFRSPAVAISPSHPYLPAC